ncbi:MAG TPA: helix-turn-helix domain-containing protein, partial [Planctomycetota bacterium]|nr:helix-turn-helix domain-containing protein [Planctomycetota bacterium]
MNEKTRHEIVRLHLGGASMRSIAAMLGMSRKTVKRVLEEHEEARDGARVRSELPRPKRRGPSILDEYEGFLSETLESFPDITAVRLLELLEAKGFRGKYTIVRERLRELRPRAPVEPVERFETPAGLQAQMDYSPYTLDFLREGRRRVHAFSYILSYSRRQYV